MRLFLAIELSEAVQSHLVRLQQALRPVLRSVSLTRPQNLHLTLKFLGEVADEQVDPLCDALRAIRPCGPLDMAVDRLICFPERGPVRIVGAGFLCPPRLLKLVGDLETACASQGFAREQRPYSAHITLARARAPLASDLRQRMEHLSDPLWPGPPMSADHFVLMHSQLDPAGAIYTPVARFAM